VIILTKIILWLLIYNSWFLDKKIVKIVSPENYLKMKIKLGFKVSFIAWLLDFTFMLLVGYVIYHMNLDFLFGGK
jgi:ABC-type sulfate transport system permease component